MAPTFEQIEGDFRFWRNFVLEDLGRIVELERGGNFAAAAVFLIGCEVLGKLRFGGQSNPEVAALADCLPRELKPVASDLYDALRNGLVHNYTTTALSINGDALGLTIAWRTGRHLALDDTEPSLVLAIPDLAAALRRSFDNFEADLRADAEARDAFYVAARRIRGQRVEVKGPRAEVWKELLATLPRKPASSQPTRSSSSH